MWHLLGAGIYRQPCDRQGLVVSHEGSANPEILDAALVIAQRLRLHTSCGLLVVFADGRTQQGSFPGTAPCRTSDKCMCGQLVATTYPTLLVLELRSWNLIL